MRPKLLNLFESATGTRLGQKVERRALTSR